MSAKARIKTAQINFISGELDPVLLGRMDKDLYYQGASLLRNVQVNPQGHVSRRPGSEYISNTTNNARSQSIEFQFNDVQKYLIVFTAGEFKVYKDDVLQTTVTSSPIDSLTETQILEMKFAQSADVLLLFNSDKQTIKITRTAHTVWTAEYLTYTNIPWFAFDGITVTEPSAQLTPGATSGRDVSFTTNNNVFTSSSVGQYITSKKGGLARITSYVSATAVKCQIEVGFATTDHLAAGDWEYETGYESVWSDLRGWPSCGAFHQGRLWLGNSGSRPQTIWGSQVSDFFNFNVDTSEDDDALDLTIDAMTNSVLNIVSGRDLQIFSAGGEYYIPTETGSPITPSKSLIVKSTSHGSSSLLPVSVGGATLFIEARGKVVREFLYNELEQNFNARNVSILSSHLIRNPVSSAYRQSTENSPADYLYVVNSDGTLAVLNVARDLELEAWSLWETDGHYEEVTTLGSDVYVTVLRTINGSSVRYVEKFDDTFFMDASIKLTSEVATTTWSGLSHLEGQEINIKGEGFVLNNATVSSGTVTSSLDVQEIEAGLPYLARVKTLPIQAVVNEKSLAGDWKRLVSVNCLLNETRNIVVKHNDKRYSPAFSFFGSELLDQPVSTFSGWKKVYVSGADRNVAIEITQDYPLELELLALMVTIK